MNWTRGTFRVSCDAAMLDRRMIADFLANQSYWAKDIPLDLVGRSIDQSLCFGLFDGKQQIGFARVVTDYTTFAYVNDVFVLPQHRGQGLSMWLMECVISHPQLQGLRRWMLATRDAHHLYEKFGFSALKRPEIFMERHAPDVYRKA